MQMKFCRDLQRLLYLQPQHANLLDYLISLERKEGIIIFNKPARIKASEKLATPHKGLGGSISILHKMGLVVRVATAQYKLEKFIFGGVLQNPQNFFYQIEYFGGRHLIRSFAKKKLKKITAKCKQ